MRKFGILAFAAVFAALGAMAITGCGSSSEDNSSLDIYINDSEPSGSPEDAAKEMTEKDVAAVGASLQTMAGYSGGYTVNEDFSLSYKVAGYSEYNSAIAMSSFVTYDAESKKMGTGSTLTGTNIYAGIDAETAYFTIPGTDGYTQYVKYVNDANNIYTGVQYASADVASIGYYYTNFADCMQNVLNLDLTAGAAATSAQEMATFWQDMMQESIDILVSQYGFTFEFTSGECRTCLRENSVVYSFSASASAATEISGEKFTDEITYFVNVELDGGMISKIITEIKQTIIATQSSGQKVKMTADSVATDEFVYAYDATLIPDDFSGYIIDGAQVV